MKERKLRDMREVVKSLSLKETRLERLEKMIKKIRKIKNKKDLDLLKIGDVVIVKDKGSMIYEGIINRKRAFIKKDYFEPSIIKSYRIGRNDIIIEKDELIFDEEKLSCEFYSKHTNLEYGGHHTMLFKGGLIDLTEP